MRHTSTIATMQTIAQTETPNEERVNLQVRVPKSVDRAVEIECAHRDVSKQQLVEQALRAYLNLPQPDAA